jgi:hypothetical protein
MGGFFQGKIHPHLQVQQIDLLRNLCKSFFFFRAINSDYCVRKRALGVRSVLFDTVACLDRKQLYIKR